MENRGGPQKIDFWRLSPKSTILNGILWLKLGNKKFFLIITSYLLWITFMDEERLVLLFKMRKDIKQYEKNILLLKHEMETIEYNKSQVVNNIENAEKFARENYYMKKRGEDIYVIKK